MMAKYLSFALAGLLFGVGLTVSGMVNPMKVLNFLDLTGSWDPTLILVMGGGLVTAAIGYRLAFRRGRPVFAEVFKLPEAGAIDTKLVAGAVLFGTGWGLTGLCPGPAVASLVFGNSQSIVFVAAMAAGAMLVRFSQRKMTR
jgi:hypothetical protein